MSDSLYREGAGSFPRDRGHSRPGIASGRRIPGISPPAPGVQRYVCVTVHRSPNSAAAAEFGDLCTVTQTYRCTPGAGGEIPGIRRPDAIPGRLWPRSRGKLPAPSLYSESDIDG